MKVIESRTIDIKVPEIVGKGRPRFTRDGRAYTPEKTKAFEQRIRLEWLARNGARHKGFEGPVYVDIVTQRQLSKSNPKRNVGKSDCGKPDIDNISKVVLDALNGLAFKDDSQVIELKVTKRRRAAHGEGNRLSVAVMYLSESADDFQAYLEERESNGDK